MADQVLMIVRVMISLVFTVLNIFVMTEYRFSKKAAYSSILILFALCMVVNACIVTIWGLYTLSQVFLLTMTLPFVLLLLVITKDNIFKSQFNFWVQVSVFWVVYVITNYLEYRFHISLLADVLVRLALYLSISLFYIKVVRKPYRDFVNVVNRGWGFFFLIPVLFSTVLMVLCNFPTPINQRPENYIACTFIVALMLLTYFAVFVTVRNTYDLMLVAQNEQRLRMEMKLQKEQYNALQEKIAADRAFRHDIRHHANLLLRMLEGGSVEEATDYIRRVGDYARSSGVKAYCENPVVNAILSTHLSAAKKQGIAVTCRAAVPQELPMDEIELCVILANLLENAVEHCTANEDTPAIAVSIVQNKDQLCIKLENTYVGQLRLDANGDWLSQKTGGGTGLKSVRAIVARHHGVIEIAPENSRFTVCVAIGL